MYNSEQNIFLIKLIFDKKLREDNKLTEIHQSIKGASNYDIDSAIFTFWRLTLSFADFDNAFTKVLPRFSCSFMVTPGDEFEEETDDRLERVVDFIENDDYHTTIEILKLGASGSEEDDLFKFKNKYKDYIFYLLNIMGIQYSKNTRTLQKDIESYLESVKKKGNYRKYKPHI